MGDEACSYFCVGVERKYKVCNFGQKGETRWSLKQTCQLPRVFSPANALIHTKGPRHRIKIWANSPWLYSYFTQTSPSKIKNINYIFIYLCGLLCFFQRYNIRLCHILIVAEKSDKCMPSKWILLCVISNQTLQHWNFVPMIWIRSSPKKKKNELLPLVHLFKYRNVTIWFLVTSFQRCGLR